MAEDIKELHQKTNKISLSLATLSGQLEGVLPHLATKEDLSVTISTAMGKHVSGYHKIKEKSSSSSGSLNVKVIGALIGAIVALAGAIAFLSQ